MTQALDDIEGVAVIVDDILVWGTTVEEHNRRLQNALQRARELNLKLNKEKSKIQTSELSYIGHLLTRDGVKPDPQKVNAIKEINTPEDKKELQRFMGMVNYLAKFIPNLSNVTVPLRELLKKDTAWHWEEIHQKAFEEIKRRVTAENLLQYYDVSKPVVLSVDSSSYEGSQDRSLWNSAYNFFSQRCVAFDDTKRNFWQYFSDAPNIINIYTQSLLPWKQTTSP